MPHKSNIITPIYCVLVCRAFNRLIIGTTLKVGVSIIILKTRKLSLTVAKVTEIIIERAMIQTQVF